MASLNASCYFAEKEFKYPCLAPIEDYWALELDSALSTFVFNVFTTA
jgi:hypothetical protein